MDEVARRSLVLRRRPAQAHEGLRLNWRLIVALVINLGLWAAILLGVRALMG